MARGSVIASSQKINFGYHTSLDSLVTLTVCGWIFVPADNAATNYIFGNINAAQNNGWSLQFRGSFGGSAPDNLLVTARNAGVSLGYTTDNFIANNTWYFVAMVFDGNLSGNSNRLKLFVDGTQKTLTFFNTIPASIGASADAVCFFTNEAGNESYPDVYAEDFKVFNVALLAAELAGEGIKRGGMVRHDALKLWTPLHGVHDPEIEYAGTGATGTLTNSPTRETGPPRTLYTPKRISAVSLASLTNAALDAVSVGVASLSQALQFQKSLIVMASGVAALARVLTFMTALSVTAVGVPSMTKTMFVTLGVTAVGVAVQTKNMFKTLATTATGVASLAVGQIVTQAMSAVAVGVVLLGTVFQEGSGIVHQWITFFRRRRGR